MHIFYISKLTIAQAHSSFRKLLIDLLLFGEEKAAEGDEIGTSIKKKRKKNLRSLKKMSGPSHKVIKYCKGCYEKKKKGLINKNNVPKVTTYCEDCESNPHFSSIILQFIIKITLAINK